MKCLKPKNARLFPQSGNKEAETENRDKAGEKKMYAVHQRKEFWASRGYLLYRTSPVTYNLYEAG
jgi:hypothetical protein